MPPSPDIDRLKALVTELGDLSVRPDPSGGLLISQNKSEHLVRLCKEIEFTRLPRRLVFTSEAGATLEIIARNGRLFSVSDAAAPDQGLSVTTGEAEEAKAASRIISDKIAHWEQVFVVSHHLDTALDEAGAGLSPASLLEATDHRCSETPVNQPAPDENSLATVYFEGDQIVENAGREDCVERLVSLTRSGALGQEILLMQDVEVEFDQIDLITQSGTRLVVSRADIGVRVTLFGKK